MTYDIGIGRCSDISDDAVVVRLDSVMVKKLTPDQPWRRSGTSVLRCDRKLCSRHRPPQVDQELYLDSGALARSAPALLDLDGDGKFRKVDLNVILDDLDPAPAPAPQTKRTAHRGWK
jgi:hypothetical protein